MKKRKTGNPFIIKAVFFHIFERLNCLRIFKFIFFFLSFSGNHNAGGNSGFFKVPDGFPSFQDLGGGFSQTNRRRAPYDSPAPNYRRKRLLIALDPDFIQTQRLLSEKL